MHVRSVSVAEIIPATVTTEWNEGMTTTTSTVKIEKINKYIGVLYNQEISETTATDDNERQQ